MNPVEISHLTKRFKGGFALEDVTFSVPAGYVTGFVGANGAGKTTTIKAILGMIHLDRGSATCLPHERIGVVFDSPPYHGQWRVRDVERGLAPFYPTWDSEVFAREIGAAGLRPAQKVEELSRGMGMRLQMAVALAHNPELLILDEPTSGLDPLARTEMVDSLAQYMTQESHTILFSTHITADLDRLADYLVILSQGRVVANGTAADIVDSFRVVRGTPDCLTPEVRMASLGLRSTQLGWEAMLPVADAEAIAERVVVERPTIEDLAVYIAKEARGE
ncbi:ABC transporter ATP-binding protein [Actinomyces slackii]|uniref:Daunorubicin/doxorubicin resistance ATP-binding protein DrrA n=1 Tax=Actinomyces slackii TaxID=52774 RepID=A0A3S4SJH8_9ACTO|nr:ABC transporter ATP-binding protein [Actinomyces slackii]VEG74138.1 Daunorubicin/doxorubicin resistance ATP-binding protein DrrA [Actinomyces slackii]